MARRSLGQRIVSKAKRLFYQESTVILGAKHLKPEKSTSEELTLRPLTAADAPLFASGFPNIETMCRDWAGRHHGLVLELAGKPAGCMWYTAERKDEEGTYPFLFSITPPPGGVYVFASYILPEFRGSRAFFLTPQKMTTFLYEIGYRLAVATYFDPRVFTFYTKHGFFKVGELRFKRYLRFFVTRDLSGLDKLCTLYS